MNVHRPVVGGVYLPPELGDPFFQAMLVTLQREIALNRHSPERLVSAANRLVLRRAVIDRLWDLWTHNDADFELSHEDVVSATDLFHEKKVPQLQLLVARNFWVTDDGIMIIFKRWLEAHPMDFHTLIATAVHEHLVPFYCLLFAERIQGVSMAKYWEAFIKANEGDFRWVARGEMNLARIQSHRRRKKKKPARKKMIKSK